MHLSFFKLILINFFKWLLCYLSEWHSNLLCREDWLHKSCKADSEKTKKVQAIC